MYTYVRMFVRAGSRAARHGARAQRCACGGSSSIESAPCTCGALSTDNVALSVESASFYRMARFLGIPRRRYRKRIFLKSAEHIHTCMHKYMHTRSHTHTHTQTHTHARTHARTHAHVRAHAYTHACTHNSQFCPPLTLFTIIISPTILCMFQIMSNVSSKCITQSTLLCAT